MPNLDCCKQIYTGPTNNNVAVEFVKHFHERNISMKEFIAQTVWAINKVREGGVDPVILDTFLKGHFYPEMLRDQNLLPDVRLMVFKKLN